MMLIVVLLAILWPSISHAACSGSGLTWTCTAGSTLANVSSALSSATDGATITFDDGSYTWSTGSTANFSMTKAATLKCADGATCTVAVGGNAALGMNGTCTGTSSKTYRITGFTFTGASSGSGSIWFNAYNTPPCTLNNIRIDHNTFSSIGNDARVLGFGDNSNTSFFYGVVDHNTFSGSGNFLVAEFFASYGTGAPADTRGTASNMYFEDNVQTITTQNNSGAGCIDSTGSPGIVWRFNATTNCLLTAHGTTGGGGVVNFEVYGNSVTLNASADAEYTDCTRAFHHQGSGEMLLFGNRLTCNATYGNHGHAVTHYRSATPANAGYSGVQCDGTQGIDGNRTPLATYRGYPCKRQPGRDVNAVLHPIYNWDNTANSTGRVDMTIESGLWAEPEYVPEHLQLDRDVYNAVSINAQSSSSSPFNGTTGMGFGTVANRPTTCTATPESEDSGHGGVGYASTNEGTWKTATPSQGNTAMAAYTLYHCSAANTWSTEYTPYTYPHPLVGGGSPSTGGSMDVKVPDAPTMFVEYAYTAPPPQCPDRSYCMTLKGKARRQCLACQ